LFAGVPAGRERLLGVVVECDGQALLLEVVVARHPVGCLTGRLDSREEEAGEEKMLAKTSEYTGVLDY
jgi:hypothetical protein